MSSETFGISLVVKWNHVTSLLVTLFYLTKDSITVSLAENIFYTVC